MITEILLSIVVFFLLIIIIAGFKSFKLLRHFLPPHFFSSVEVAEVEPAGNSVLHSWKYKFMLLKAYFDNGYSITSYPKWAFAILGIGSAIKGYSLYWLVLGAIGYGFLCFVIGYAFLKWGFYEAQQEVSNQFNLFVKEIRERKSI